MSGVATRGFELAVVHCETCSETAEGIPNGKSTPDGLPEGWVAVTVGRYRHLGRPFEGDPTKAYNPRHLYYCSEAHLPAELLPDEPDA